MFLPFFYHLRSCGLKVSLNEWMSLMEALHQGLHDCSLTGFYQLSRMILVKSETDFDRFDRAFAEYFKDVSGITEIPKALQEWLSTPIDPRELDKEAIDRLWAGMTSDDVRRMLNERLEEQHERHDGGKRWVGTGGASMFGNSGYSPIGIRIGGESSYHNAVQVAGERRFADFRTDTTLDIRQFQMAFRRLRKLTTRNEGPKDELQLNKTVQSTCDNGGYLKLEFDRPRTNEIRLLLLFDSGGSMLPFSQMCGRLFRAANQSSRFKELKTYYFHNCPYDTVAEDAKYWNSKTVETEHLIRTLTPEWRVIFVGDAAMSPSELTDAGGCSDYHHYNEKSGLYYIHSFAEKFSHLVWLNPLSESSWDYMTSIQMIHREVPMYPLTLEGLDRALMHLLVSR